jgi:hypothetical protein
MMAANSSPRRLRAALMVFGMPSRASRATSWAKVAGSHRVFYTSNRVFLDGLTQIFATVKVTPNVRDLPANYKAVLEWARMS